MVEKRVFEGVLLLGTPLPWNTLVEYFEEEYTEVTLEHAIWGLEFLDLINLDGTWSIEIQWETLLGD